MAYYSQLGLGHVFSCQWVVVVAVMDLQSHQTHGERENSSSLRGNRGAGPSSKWFVQRAQRNQVWSQKQDPAPLSEAEHFLQAAHPVSAVEVWGGIEQGRSNLSTLCLLTI